MTLYSASDGRNSATCRKLTRAVRREQVAEARVHGGVVGEGEGHLLAGSERRGDARSVFHGYLWYRVTRASAHGSCLTLMMLGTCLCAGAGWGGVCDGIASDARPRRKIDGRAQRVRVHMHVSATPGGSHHRNTLHIGYTRKRDVIRALFSSREDVRYSYTSVKLQGKRL